MTEIDLTPLHCSCLQDPTTCEPVRCRMRCPFGWARNTTTGCEMCACAERPEPTCEPVRCLMRCEHGFVKDPDTGEEAPSVSHFAHLKYSRPLLCSSTQN